MANTLSSLDEISGLNKGWLIFFYLHVCLINAPFAVLITCRWHAITVEYHYDVLLNFLTVFSTACTHLKISLFGERLVCQWPRNFRCKSTDLVCWTRRFWRWRLKYEGTVDVCSSGSSVEWLCAYRLEESVLCCRLRFDAAHVCSPFELSCETFVNWNIDRVVSAEECGGLICPCRILLYFVFC